MEGATKAAGKALSNATHAVVGQTTKVAAKQGVYPNPMMRPEISKNVDYLTTNTGAPIANNNNTLTIGERGPALLEDQHFLEKMQQFDREKTPERVVHARGFTAKGHFEVTADISDVCHADFLSGKGKQTPVAVRFSTVVHGKDSPESLRDVRGFSTKFYTQQGNWDLVGNNIPVFFIRDGMQFPDLVHALRPNPISNIQEGWRILDFLSFHPESANILTWLLDDPGIPQDWRSLEGYGVNTFKMINENGKETLVKFHWRPSQGAKFLTDEEAASVGEANMRHSHATHDLYNAIEAGDYPQWEFYIQTLDPKDELSLPFDPLDCTKEWPEEDFPLREVGRMTLNQNIDNFHNESEQIAFSPGIAVPGITFSDDKVLQTRVFSYSDTQRYRLGGNYQQLPINQPKCPFHNNHDMGAMQWNQRDSEVNYWPSTQEPETAKSGHDSSNKHWNWSREHVEGVRVKKDINEDGKYDDLIHAKARYKGMDERRKANFHKQLVNWMADVKCPEIVREKWLGIWGEVDSSLASALQSGIKEKMASAPTNGAKVGTTMA